MLMTHRLVKMRLLTSRWATTMSTSIFDNLFQVEGELTKLAPRAIPAVGMEAQVTHAFSIEDTRAFAGISGDNNSLHVDADFAVKHASKSKPIVQGLLSGSLFATIFGRTVPGALYITQNIRWKAPLLVDEKVTARICVTKVRKRFVECDTVCTKTSDGVVVAIGNATLLLPSPVNQESIS
ncbi:unnamed protein product [Peronospora destructor]|uniref:MaoC-like domain-containing protein n=1 Tax=Peronospora destructor TaxID=86335 RepID=A0AAV0V6J6_9STRA|nr:unnamed protein product [Peronospora destructor]